MKFGTSGLRGLVADMTDAVVAGYVLAFLAHLAGEGRPAAFVLVGRDLRPSSPGIAAACRAAIRAAGVDAVDCGALPTPALALEAAAQGAPAIMVTGSHIPFDRNGLKFYRPEGEITKADEAGILAARGRVPAPAARPGGERADAQALSRYRARNLDFLGQDALAGLTIGVHQHSAVGRDLIADALSSLGARIVALGRADVFVPVDTEAVSAEDAEQARIWAAEHRLDALVTTDGDGDRPLIADERGVFLRGDVVGLLAARSLGADAVATPISSSTALERSGWVARVARTRIGSPFVIEALERLAAEGARLPVGYEANGGFLLGAPAPAPGGGTIAPLPTRDALLPMLALLGEAARRTAPLSALVAEAPARVTASDRLTGIGAERSGPFLETLAADPAVQKRLARAIGVEAVLSVNALDGVRLTLSGDEIAHLRASGNAPELRGYAEAADPDRAVALVARLLAAARAELDRPRDGR
ncbi:MAG: phosphomannomutase [Rhodobacteraceae bacterium]|nr:MAG: phosphomannomutase [Paracoccaceae bacterium]